MTILSGFLGAGKTTLHNHVLHGNHGLKIAMLVTNLGAINIDSEEGKIVNLSNGRIFCTIHGDLLKETLKLLRREDPQKYIIIETSGVSDPISIANTFLMSEVKLLVRLDSVLILVDADHNLSLKEENYTLAMDQIALVDIVVLNKVDLVTVEDLEDIKTKVISRIVPEAHILEVSYGQVSLELVLGVGKYALERVWQLDEKNVHEVAKGHQNEHDEHTNHTLVFSTWSWTTDKPLTLGKLRGLVEKMPNNIYRAKGVIYLHEMPDNRMILQLVSKRASLTLVDRWGGEPPNTQIVVIASQGGLDVGGLHAQMEGYIVDEIMPAAVGQPVDRTEWTCKCR